MGLQYIESIRLELVQYVETQEDNIFLMVPHNHLTLCVSMFVYVNLNLHKELCAKVWKIPCGTPSVMICISV